jgi:hypothetical protein
MNSPKEIWQDKDGKEITVWPEELYIDTRPPKIIGWHYLANGKQEFYKESPEERGLMRVKE